MASQDRTAAHTTARTAATGTLRRSATASEGSQRIRVQVARCRLRGAGRDLVARLEDRREAFVRSPTGADDSSKRDDSREGPDMTNRVTRDVLPLLEPRARVCDSFAVSGR